MVSRWEGKERVKGLYWILPDTSLGGESEEKKELLMECSHLVDPVAVSGRKAGDR